MDLQPLDGNAATAETLVLAVDEPPPENELAALARLVKLAPALCPVVTALGHPASPGPGPGPRAGTYVCRTSPPSAIPRREPLDAPVPGTARTAPRTPHTTLRADNSGT